MMADAGINGLHSETRAEARVQGTTGPRSEVFSEALFSDPAAGQTERLVAFIHAHSRPVTIMEVCGTHTAAIAQSGLRSLLPQEVRLVSGPGCPVCVTPAAYIDRLIEIALRPGACALAFGDLLRVPGSRESLAQAQARGARVRVIYAPMEAVRLAKAHPDTTFTLAAIGFEATTPLYALVLDAALREDVRNLTLLTSLKTMIPAMEAICAQERIDGFLCPGHVSVCIGSGAYEPLCRQWRRPFVVVGFEAQRILAAVAHILLQLESGRPSVENLYPGVVTREGNVRAMEWTRRFFTPVDAVWRGLGRIPLSGLRIRREYARFDAAGEGSEAEGAMRAGSEPNTDPQFPPQSEPNKDPQFPPQPGIGTRATPDAQQTTWAMDDASETAPGCRCGDVMLGRIEPQGCPMFAGVCTPEHPVGACMVSREGACGIAWHAGGGAR